MKVNHVSYEVHKEPVLFNLKSEIYNPLNFTKSKKINYQSNSFNYSNSNNNYLYYSYVLDDEKSLIPLFKSNEESFENEINTNYYEINSISRIRVPIGSKVHLERKIPKKLLSEVNKNQEKAVELCLLMLSIVANKNLNHSWVRLSSKRLMKIRYNYKSIIEVLKYTNGNFQPLIVVKSNDFDRESYKSGEETKKYSLSECYKGNKLFDYEIKNKAIVNPYLKLLNQELHKNIENAIINNILKLYPRLTYPTNQQIKNEAKRLIKLGFVSKKGKKLIFRKDLKNSLDKSNFMIVEDCINRFNSIISNPEILEPSNLKAGGRVTYKLNLINSWIRSLIKIDNEETVELDFKALHPNIAIKLYGGKTMFITHDIVAEKLNIVVKKVKKQHLSYFNEQIYAMKNRLIHQFYSKNEPEFVENIINDKRINGYRITSRKMFEYEVKIMSEVIRILNSKGVYMIYIYDALACRKSDLKLVKKTMEEVVLKFGVYTTASVANKFINENFGLIYKATNSINGYSYIGTTTKSIEERKLDHFQRIDKKYGSKFQDALKEYGKENFLFEQIDTASSVNELALKEKKYIEVFDSKNKGYNSDTGGGFKKLIYQFDYSGNLITTFQNLEDAAKYVNVSINSISDACLGGRKTCANYFWSYLPEIEIKKDKRVRKVSQFTLEGQFIKEYDSIVTASDETCINKSSIAKCCNGKRNRAGDFIWKYPN
ncbi:MAG: NUMOD1 domain-containing DNA-binding protein [Bacteroidota bacterium]